MDNRLKQDALIEDALNTYPLAEMPHGVTANVMARIQKNTRPTLVTWNDFAISLVIATCVGALFLTAQSLPPLTLAKLHIQRMLLYHDILVNSRWLLPALLFGLAAFVSVLTIPYLRRDLTD